MAIVEVSIVPIGTGSTGVSSYVARALEVLQDEGVDYQLTAMGTILSGDLDRLLSVLRRMHESCFDMGAGRVLTRVVIDDRRDVESSPEEKIRSVSRKIAQRS